MNEFIISINGVKSQSVSNAPYLTYTNQNFPQYSPPPVPYEDKSANLGFMPDSSNNVCCDIPEEIDAEFPNNKMQENFNIEVDEDYPKTSKPGFIVLHQYIGEIPSSVAETICQQQKNNFTTNKEWLDFRKAFPEWNFLLIPQKDQDSFVEIYHEDQNEREYMEGIIAKGMPKTQQPIKNTQKLREQAQNYTLMMLGAPAVELELTQDQLDFCYEHSLNTINDYAAKIKEFTLLDSFITQCTDFLFAGTLAHATIVLSRIRGESNKSSIFNLLSPEDLYKDGKERLAKWKQSLGIHIDY